MGLRDWIPRKWRPSPGPGQTPIHIDDPSFDSWEVVRDFADVRTARAWHQEVLDRYGRGDISLRVPADRWSEAEWHLSNLDDEWV